MLKKTAFSLIVLVVGGVASAKAGCNGSQCTIEPSCAACAQAAPADDHSKMNMPAARAPQSTRSFSYQPSNSYAPTRARNVGRPGWNAGVRGATAKVLGNY